MFKKILLLLILSLGSVVTVAEAADLVIPKELNVLFVNGEKYGGSFFNTKNKKLKLPAGSQRIVLQYEHFFGDDEDYDRAKSEPFLLQLSLLQGEKYLVKIPTMERYEQAKAFMVKPDVTVVEQSSGNVVSSVISRKKTDGEFVDELVGEPENGKSDGEPSQTLEQMLYWWGKADGEQRQQFLQQVLSK